MKYQKLENEEQLVKKHFNLIYHAIYKLKLQNELDEYVDLGMLGLLKGIRTFDKTKNYKESTYIMRCILNEINTYRRNMTNKKHNYGLPDISLSTVVHNEGIEEIALEDVLASDIDIYKDIEKIDTNKLFKKLKISLSNLRDDEYFTITSYYGIGRKVLTQKEIAKELGLTQAYISRKIKQIIKKLQKDFKDEIKEREENFYEI